MKNVLKTFVATAVAAVMNYNADAQSAAVNLSQNNAPGSCNFYPGEQKDKNALSDIHPRAVKDFQRSFKSITDEQWSRLNDGYIANFTRTRCKQGLATIEREPAIPCVIMTKRNYPVKYGTL